MHYKQVKGILSAQNGMNLYRGCTHGCIYCDSRSKCYQMDHDFEDIEVKENALVLLENTLKHKRNKCMIGLGAMSDPYMPLENKLQYTHKALELANKYGFGFSLITKSDQVLNDLDLIKSINSKTKCVVQMTLTTIDDDLCKIIEPNVSLTSSRIKALKELNKNNIPTIVWLSPILPFINDNEENIRGIIEACKEAKVKGIICFGMTLTLREGNREYFYQQLDKSFPTLKSKYQRFYGNQYVCNSTHHKALMKLFHNLCSEYNIMHDNNKIFKYLSTFEQKEEAQQLSLF